MFTVFKKYRARRLAVALSKLSSVQRTRVEPDGVVYARCIDHSLYKLEPVGFFAIEVSTVKAKHEKWDRELFCCQSEVIEYTEVVSGVLELCRNGLL